MQANEIIQKNPNWQFIARTTHMPYGFVDDFHSHPWHQIVFPLKGLLQSSIADKCVIVPHNAMLYIPANTFHKAVAVTDTQFLAVYLNPDKIAGYSISPKPCLVTPFIKELVLLLVDKGMALHSEADSTSLLTVLRDQIDIASSYEIPLLIPTDKRLMSVFNQLKQQPDLPYTLEEWAQRVGASERTISRLCAKEFDLSFSLWRQNIRLVLSLQLLDSPRSIQDIALELGYSSDSAYIYAFKQLFNKTPSKYRSDNLMKGLLID
ncbi:HTH-type transcriptional repressor of iron proteins A [compost metagenome]